MLNIFLLMLLRVMIHRVLKKSPKIHPISLMSIYTVPGSVSVTWKVLEI